MTQLIRIAHSPDSDDAYMFWAIKHGHVGLPGYAFSVERRDIEELNQLAVTGEYEITAVSFHAYAYLHERYDLLASGASFAENDYGPMLVAKSPLCRGCFRNQKSKSSSFPRRRESSNFNTFLDPRLRGDDYKHHCFDFGNTLCKEGLGEVDPRKLSVAIPGAWTTSALLLHMLLPKAQTVVMPFELIMDAVISGEVDAGLIIHEGQMQYAEQGLVCVAKMLDVWHGILAKAGKSGLPLPLGGNAIRRDLDSALMGKLASLMYDSIAYARAHHAEARAYALSFKRELTDAQADLYLSWYANERTLDMGEDGKVAVQVLLDAAHASGLIKNPVQARFL
jgi:1,4-dihydroxy-6-naphthoate synthase